MYGLKSSRRNVLKLLGLAPTAPIALKAQMDEEVAKLAGVRLGGVAPGLSSGGLLVSDSPMQTAEGHALACERASDYINTFGPPDLLKEVLFRQARAVYELDPDLAAKRSWSMSVKILTQRERNYKRLLESYHFNSRLSRMRKMFRKLTGWDLPL